MNPDHSTYTSNNEDEIKSSTQLKQDDNNSANSIGTDSVKNPPRFQFGQRDQASCASSSTGEVSQAIDSLLLMHFQDFVGVSSKNWQWDDENSCNFSFADSITVRHDEDYKEEDKDETDEDDEEKSICDSIRVTHRRRLKQSTMSSSDNKYSE